MYENDGASLRCFLLKCPEEKRKIFSSSEIALLISIGQPYHEGEKMWAMTNFINKSFGKCNIMVNDSLQRYTIMLEERGKLTLDEAYKKSIEEGQEWVKRNLHFLKSLSIPYTLHYWDSWLKRDDYPFYKNKIDYFYQNDPEFIKNMDITIHEFIRRNQEKAEEIGLDISYNLCLKYLLEECAVIMGVWQNFGYNFVLYPGKMIDILKYTRSVLVNNESLYWLHIKFRRNNKRLYQEKIGSTLWEREEQDEEGQLQ